MYVEADLKNLGGLNAELGHSGANEIYAEITRIFAERLRASGISDDQVFFRHGGDEFGVFLHNVRAKDWKEAQEKVRKIMLDIQSEIAAMIKERNLDKIPHAKYPNDPSKRGAGITFGIAKIALAKGGDAIADAIDPIFKSADNDVERMKALY